jgi:broad-specificity NMP kinase
MPLPLITKANVNTYYSGLNEKTNASSGKMDGFMAKMIEVAGTDPKAHDNPFFIVLGGTPGVGKSSSIRKIMGDSKDYFIFSLDNIVENYDPYRAKSRELVEELTGVKLTESKNKYKNQAKLDENYKKIEDFLSKLQGPYTSVIHYKSKDHKILYLRNEILKEALRRKYNIVFDTTFQSGKEIIEENIIKHMSDEDKKIYKKFKIIHVFADDDTIREQLQKRHKEFIKTKNYIRAVPETNVVTMSDKNKVGFEKAIEKYGSDPRFEFCTYENMEGKRTLECGVEAVETKSNKVETVANRTPPMQPNINNITNTLSELTLQQNAPPKSRQKRGKPKSVGTRTNAGQSRNNSAKPKTTTRKKKAVSTIKENSNSGSSNENKKKEVQPEPEPVVPSVSRYGRIRTQAKPK